MSAGPTASAVSPLPKKEPTARPSVDVAHASSDSVPTNGKRGLSRPAVPCSNQAKKPPTF